MYRQLMTALVCSLILAVTAFAQQVPQPQAQRTADKTAPLSVLSIIPAQGEPGMTVTLNGSGFTATTAAFLGSLQLPTTVVGGKVLTLELPDLPPGVYALYLKRDDGTTSRPYNFMIQAQKPLASTLSPDTVSTCATGRDREVILSGSFFQNGARILLDGAAIATRFISPSALAFLAPQLPAGMHQVQVRNPSDTFSGNLALFMDSKPEILGVSVGSEYVSYYELMITGKNFQQTSTLVVDGNRIGTGKQVVGEREQLVFLGCGQLLYQRHPYDPTPKDIRLQVVNQNGEESGVFTISAP
jgi:hypothetical protein